MNCLYCGTAIPDSSKPEELASGWHLSCVKKFFHTSKMPDIDLSEEAMLSIAAETIARGFTVPGVQKKLSLHLETGNAPRLTIVNYPAGFILKPQTAEYQALPEAEHLAMQMAARTGIKTVPFALVRLPADQNRFAYITKRIDRILPNNKSQGLQMLAMEDFCQLDGRLTQDKYRGSYERCAKIITQYSMNPGLDLSELFLRLVFSFMIGNSDMHLKNFSLIEEKSGSGTYALSAAYDLLPVNIIMPQDTEQMALTLNGKKAKLHRQDFMAFAGTCGISRKSAEKMIDKVSSMQQVYIAMCRDSYLPESMKEPMENLIRERTLLQSHEKQGGYFS
jgi:serine/threonine-protein kinase HipA